MATNEAVTKKNGVGVFSNAERMLNLRNTLQKRLEQLDSVEVYGSGQTTEEEPTADITFEYVGRKYKLSVEDRGLVS